MYSTLRDWEWMDIGMTTDLDEGDKARIWWMLTGDCDFLARQVRPLIASDGASDCI